MAWIELHQARQRHPKTLKLSALLNADRRYTCGLLDDLWTWALDVADVDGELPGLTGEDIAVALDFPRKKGAWLMGALVSSGYVDVCEDGVYRIHNWYEYAGKLNDKREKDAKRKRTSPAHPSEIQRNSIGNPTDVHRKSVATVPNRTLPYLTVPETTNNYEEDTGVTVPADAVTPAPVAKKTRTRSAPFAKPTRDEVATYCGERGSVVDPVRWYDHYQANGWMCGRTPMRDWKAAVRQWERNGINTLPSQKNASQAPTSAQGFKPNPALEYTQRKYDDDEFQDDYFRQEGKKILDEKKGGKT